MPAKLDFLTVLESIPIPIPEKNGIVTPLAMTQGEGLIDTHVHLDLIKKYVYYA